jgi:hypothetical protein
MPFADEASNEMQTGEARSAGYQDSVHGAPIHENLPIIVTLQGLLRGLLHQLAIDFCKDEAVSP